MSSSTDKSESSKKKKITPKRRPEGVRLAVDVELCKGCGFCVEFCPTGALEMSEEYNRKGYHPPRVIEADCVYCEVCELICPEFSIYCVDVEKADPGNGGGPDGGK